MSFSTRLPVRPRHCDAQGMLHAARYYEYFEEAFLRWLTTVSLPYAALRASGVDLVIVESRCVHHEPARLDDELEVRVHASRRSDEVLGVRFDVERGGALLAEGSCTYVAVAHGRSTALPAPLRSATADREDDRRSTGAQRSPRPDGANGL